MTRKVSTRAESLGEQRLYPSCPTCSSLLADGWILLAPHREWFGVLARQMFNPDYALFQPQAADSLTYQPNKVRLKSGPAPYVDTKLIFGFTHV